MSNDFGFTNNVADLERVESFRQACIADGWTIEPTYPDHESVDRAFRLKKYGFHIQGLTRVNEPGAKWHYEAKLDCWGPDSLAITLPEVYDFEKIKAGLRTCNACKATDVDTERYSFAGRCCAKCLPEMRRKHEYPGWTN